MLGNAAPTPYDLRFSLLGIPVRVHPFFWLFSAVMGWDAHDPNYMLLWIACVFVSILIHEFGHALTAQYYGWPPEVVLYSFGGYAAYTPTWGYTTARRIIISLAGPGAGFLFYGLVLLAEELLLRTRILSDDGNLLRVIEPENQGMRYCAFVLRQLEFINLWWGLVNLLPVYPLDGGHVSRELLSHFRPRDGVEISLKLSVLVGGAVAAYFFMQGRTFAAILFASLTIESLQHLQGRHFR